MGQRGRPELPPKEVRSALIGVRVKPEERELIREAAGQQDKSMSDWAREILVRAAQAQTSPAKKASKKKRRSSKKRKG